MLTERLNGQDPKSNDPNCTGRSPGDSSGSRSPSLPKSKSASPATSSSTAGRRAAASLLAACTTSSMAACQAPAAMFSNEDAFKCSKAHLVICLRKDKKQFQQQPSRQALAISSKPVDGVDHRQVDHACPSTSGLSKRKPNHLALVQTIASVLDCEPAHCQPSSFTDGSLPRQGRRLLIKECSA